MSLTGLIGHTGFVGSNLIRPADFDQCYNSHTIADIQGKVFDLLICTGSSRATAISHFSIRGDRLVSTYPNL